MTRSLLKTVVLSLCIVCRLATADVEGDDGQESSPQTNAKPRKLWNTENEHARGPIHTSWGAEDYSDDFSRTPPDGVSVTVTSSYLKSAFGVSEVAF